MLCKSFVRHSDFIFTAATQSALTKLYGAPITDFRSYTSKSQQVLTTIREISRAFAGFKNRISRPVYAVQSCGACAGLQCPFDFMHVYLLWQPKLVFACGHCLTFCAMQDCFTHVQYQHLENYCAGVIIGLDSWEIGWRAILAIRERYVLVVCFKYAKTFTFLPLQRHPAFFQNSACEHLAGTLPSLSDSIDLCSEIFKRAQVHYSGVCAGLYHSCAIIETSPTTGQVQCWGYNEHGQAKSWTDLLKAELVEEGGK